VWQSATRQLAASVRRRAAWEMQRVTGGGDGMIHRLLCIAAVAAALACGKGGREPASATTTGASASDGESAAQSLATARCDREETCKNVGSGRTYASRNACMDELRDKTRSELNASDCPGGVDNGQLEKCLSEIRGEKCGNVLDTITRLAACRTSALCVQ
jgi:hypothetical protein